MRLLSLWLFVWICLARVSHACSDVGTNDECGTITTDTVAATIYPALFVCHGGGPLPLLNDDNHREIVASWERDVTEMVLRHGKPQAILVISAHYPSRDPLVVRVCHRAFPPMYYDYGGFPAASYRLLYKAPSNTTLAEEIVSELKTHNITSELDDSCRYDHGVFVPLMKMFPEATIPVVPISYLSTEDPGQHMLLGQALRKFRLHSMLLLGSGSSMHNFDLLWSQARRRVGDEFNDALTFAIRSPMAASDRWRKLTNVRAFPGFRDAHPPDQTEHLMPLLVVAGSSEGRAGDETANLDFYSGNVRHYRFDL